LRLNGFMVVCSGWTRMCATMSSGFRSRTEARLCSVCWHATLLAGGDQYLPIARLA
jgi:hypothetical protein